MAEQVGIAAPSNRALAPARAPYGLIGRGRLLAPVHSALSAASHGGSRPPYRTRCACCETTDALVGYRLRSARIPLVPRRWFLVASHDADCTPDARDDVELGGVVEVHHGLDHCASERGLFSDAAGAGVGGHRVLREQIGCVRCHLLREAAPGFLVRVRGESVELVGGGCARSSFEKGAPMLVPLIAGDLRDDRIQ